MYSQSWLPKTNKLDTRGNVLGRAFRINDSIASQRAFSLAPDSKMNSSNKLKARDSRANAFLACPDLTRRAAQQFCKEISIYSFLGCTHNGLPQVSFCKVH